MTAANQVNLTIFDYLDYDIQHFKENPPSKINDFKVNSDVSNKYLLPMFEHLKTLKTEREILTYFENMFFLGKSKYTPYAEFYKFLIREKGARALFVVDNFTDFVYVINRHGILYGNASLNELIYPPEMTANDFRESLSEQDVKDIIRDSERLCRLHSNSEKMKRFVNDRLKDYGINHVIDEVEI